MNDHARHFMIAGIFLSILIYALFIQYLTLISGYRISASIIKNVERAASEAVSLENSMPGYEFSNSAFIFKLPVLDASLNPVFSGNDYFVAEYNSGFVTLHVIPLLGSYRNKQKQIFRNIDSLNVNKIDNYINLSLTVAGKNFIYGRAVDEHYVLTPGSRVLLK